MLHNIAIHYVERSYLLFLGLLSLSEVISFCCFFDFFHFLSDSVEDSSVDSTCFFFFFLFLHFLDLSSDSDSLSVGLSLVVSSFFFFLLLLCFLTLSSDSVSVSVEVESTTSFFFFFHFLLFLLLSFFVFRICWSTNFIYMRFFGHFVTYFNYECSHITFLVTSLLKLLYKKSYIMLSGSSELNESLMILHHAFSWITYSCPFLFLLSLPFSNFFWTFITLCYVLATYHQTNT